MNMFIILFVVLISQVYVDDKTNRIVHFKDGQFIICQLSLHNAMWKWIYHFTSGFIDSTTPSSDLRIKAGADGDTLATIEFI